MLMVKNRRMHSHQNSENATNESTSSTNTVPVVVSVSTTAGNTITNNIPPRVRNKEHSLASHIPGYVTKLEDTKAGGRYLCTPCQSHCNSDIQLSQHLSSRKHMEKLSRKMNSTNGVMGGERCHVVDISNRPIHQGNIFCHVCKLSFSSQSVMDTHMTGSKHQRKLKSIELIKSLEGTEPGFKYDTLTGDIICTLCDVIFYSPQHIKRHIEGEKHKGKRENGEEGGTPAKKHCAANLGHSVNDNEHSSAGFEASEGNAITTITSSSMTSNAPPRKDQALLNMNIPSCVSKVEDPKTGGKFLCNPCQAHCNSDIQLSQHLSSKKHLDKMVLYCDVCYISFTSEVLLDSHLMGAKHKRKRKWKELLKSLESTEPSFSFDPNTGDLKCSLCNVSLYSPQHILTHIDGEKHTSHLSGSKDGDESTLALKLLLSATLEQNSPEDGRSGGSSSGERNTPPTIATSISTATTTALTLSSMLQAKKERPTVKMTIPAYVTKVDDPKTCGKYLCTPCHVQCNSDMQLSQHLTSKKHADKLSGRKRSPSGMRGNWRGGRGGGSMSRGRGGTPCRGGGVIQRMDLMAPNSAFHSNNNVGAYPHPSFADQNISNYGTGDSYGLSSLGRGAVSEYGGFGRPGVGGRGGRGCAAGRNDPCGRVEGDYGRGAPSVYTRQDNHSRWSDYGAGRAEEINYGRPTAEYAARAYGSGQSVGHMSGRGMPFTYTQPLSQNFVSGGTIL